MMTTLKTVPNNFLLVENLKLFTIFTPTIQEIKLINSWLHAIYLQSTKCSNCTSHVSDKNM